MSAINLYRRPEVAWLFSDGASYDIEGRLRAITGKTHVLASLSCAMLFSGRSIVGAYIAHMLERDATDFDHALQILPTWLPGMVDALTELHGTDPAEEAVAQGRQQGFQIFLAGWSDRRGEIVAADIATVDNRKGPAFTLHESPNGFQSPGVTAEENQRGFGGPLTINAETIEQVAETVLELQRHQRWADGKFYVGGLVELITVKRDSVTTKILKRWPEDQIGELIKPRPIDWAAWRVRQGTSIEGGSVIKLSRQERRAAAAQSRRGR